MPVPVVSSLLPSVLVNESPTYGAIEGLLASLDPSQRAAAVLPDGPAQIIAPAGSGKTTTLIARLGVLLGRGVRPDQIAVVTFNREAAQELRARILARLAPLVPGAETIEVRTLHAVARQVLLDGGRSVELVPDRLPLLRAARRRCMVGRSPEAPPIPDVGSLDTCLSAWKVERRPPPVEAEPVLTAYATLLAARHAFDFDDLVVGAADRLERDPRLRLAWQRRFIHICVDEFQDVDAAQLRLVRIIAEPEQNLFVVGDDDQTIYAWRLADVRRILDFSVSYPSARRVQLATNYRCPPRVVAASARLIDVNLERFAKSILAGKPAGAGALATARHGGDARDALLAYPTTAPDWPERLASFAAARATGGRRACLLARTRAELGPVALALVRAGIPHAMTVRGPLDDDAASALVEDLARAREDEMPFAALLRARAARGWRREGQDDAIGDDSHAALDALVGWSAGFRSVGAFLAALHEARDRFAALRDPAAPLELISVHAAKGREWETVIILGFEEDRFPNRRALVGAVDPERAVEEERRLAYVALTRATEQLVIAFDPAKPSRFLAEMGMAGPVR
jgi:DNA helicase-2/ATP-dependent DNA helicase PcrA